jgi:CheY-like chemotaxis protein
MMGIAVKIVMVEDDEGHARLIEKNIRRAGVANDIAAFSDGTSALHYLFSSEGLRSEANPHPTLILLDLNLPDMSGIEILKRIKEDDHLRCAPVVVLTTTDDKAEIQRCYELGCNVYITKPLNYDSFASAIRQLGLFFSVIQIPEPA